MSVRSLPDPEIFAAYALTSELASGELTTLHAARALSSGDAQQTYAVKRLQRGHVRDPEWRALLLAAGHAGLVVQAPQFARVIEVHEQPEPFLVMEHIQGLNLSSLLAFTRADDVTHYVLPILVDVLEGLQMLHSLRGPSGESAAMVHGAPCARHIMIGMDGQARLVDLTHAIGPGLPWSARRDDRLQPSEMAPEQALAPAHVDPRADLFIVGAVFWQALTGHPLFGGESRETALDSMLRAPIRAPGESGARQGRRFDEICLKALQRARAERYGSAAEMAYAIREEAQRAGLYAAREEIGALVKSLVGGNVAHGFREPVPARSDALRAAAGRNTVLEFTWSETGLTTRPTWRPSRPSVQSSSWARARTTPELLALPAGTESALPANARLEESGHTVLPAARVELQSAPASTHLGWPYTQEQVGAVAGHYVPPSAPPASVSRAELALGTGGGSAAGAWNDSRQLSQQRDTLRMQIPKLGTGSTGKALLFLLPVAVAALVMLLLDDPETPLDRGQALELPAAAQVAPHALEPAALPPTVLQALQAVPTAAEPALAAPASAAPASDTRGAGRGQSRSMDAPQPMEPSAGLADGLSEQRGRARSGRRGSGKQAGESLPANPY